MLMTMHVFRNNKPCSLV